MFKQDTDYFRHPKEVMTYEEFRETMVRFSSCRDCLMFILDKNGDKQKLTVTHYGLFSSIFDDDGYNGCLSWKKIENLLEENKWENYPHEKQTIMCVNEEEYPIEVYFLTDIN